MGFGITTDQLERLGINAPPVTEDFGTFDTRKRHSDVIREGQDTSWVDDVTNWVGDQWQNTITQVPEEDTGISNVGAPEAFQGELSHVPSNSKPYAIRQLLRNYFSEAAKGGHAFDVFQDENSGHWVYTDPNTMKPTWVEPPGIETGDWSDDGAVMAWETGGAGAGGAIGFGLGGPPGMYFGSAIGSGIATGGYTYNKLYDLLERGLLDPNIYGTAEHPNEEALNGEVTTQAAISAGGSLAGDTLMFAGKKGFSKLAQTRPFRAKFPKLADRYLLQDSLTEASRVQKGPYPLFSEEDWPVQTSASILQALAKRQGTAVEALGLGVPTIQPTTATKSITSTAVSAAKALVRRPRITIGEQAIGKGTGTAAGKIESQATSTTVKDSVQSVAYDDMTEEQALALENLGFGTTQEQQKAAGILMLDPQKVADLKRVSIELSQMESSALNWKNSGLLRDKHQARVENIHKRYTEMLQNSGLDKDTVRTLGQQYLKQANNDLHKYLGETRIYDSGEFNADVTQTATELTKTVADLIRFTSDPAKANSSVKSAFASAESILDSRVNQAYLNILGDDFNPDVPMFDASQIEGTVLKQIKKLPKLFPQLSGDTTFIKNLQNNIFDADGNPLKLSWADLDKEIKILRQTKRAVWNTSTDRINKQTLLDIEQGLLDWRYNTLKGTSGEDVLVRLNEADSLTRAAHATFDSELISSLVGDNVPIKEKKLFALLTSDNIGDSDVYYIKNLMDSYIGDPYSKVGPQQLTPIPKQHGDDLYEATREAFYNSYRRDVLKEDTNLGPSADIAGIDRKVTMSREQAHDNWITDHKEYLEKWLDPEDVARFYDINKLSTQLRAESEILKEIQKMPGMKDSNTVFQTTYGPGPAKYAATENVWQVLHHQDGEAKAGAEKYIKQYQRMIFNDINDKILKTNLKDDPNITSEVFVDFKSIDDYIKKNHDSMELWLGPDKIRELKEIRYLAELATTWRTNHPEKAKINPSDMLNDGLRAYVGMFTRTGRALTGYKRFKARGENQQVMAVLLDAEVAAKRINHLDRSRIMNMFNIISMKPGGRELERDQVDTSNISDVTSGAPKPDTSQYNWDLNSKLFTQGVDEKKKEFTQGVDDFKANFNKGYKDGGVVHDYQLPTLNRPDYMDGMMQEGVQEALQTIQALREAGREQEAVAIERELEASMLLNKQNQGTYMQLPNESGEGYRQRAGGMLGAEMERTAEQGYAEGGLVTQDQMQGIMQQLSGVQPTAQARPIIPPLIDDVDAGNGIMLPDSGVMSVDTDAGYAPTMTKKQKEKAKVKAIKKGNKRQLTAPPPTTGILSGF